MIMIHNNNNNRHHHYHHHHNQHRFKVWTGQLEKKYGLMN